MNFNKCSRCGCFFLTKNQVCPSCEAKDQVEMNRLQNYIEENVSENTNIETICSSTGISSKNLTRFLAQEQFTSFANQLHSSGQTGNSLSTTKL